VEELVAERAVSCAGKHVSVVSFAATAPPVLRQSLLRKFDLPEVRPEQLIVLPEDINSNLTGDQRNQRIKASLQGSISGSNLVMAQPYIGKDMAGLYQIPPEVTTKLNDKSNMHLYIEESYMPQRLASLQSGKTLAGQCAKQQLPFVIKASASSAGDGVYICQTDKDIKAAVKDLSTFKGNIIIEQYIKEVNNYGVHFGIPYSTNEPIDFIGINEQLTTPEGEFVGGIIKSEEFPEQLKEVKSYLLTTILPKVRAMGWYGVGCFDVIIDDQSKAYFIDCNFRMTGMSAYHFLIANSTLKTPLVGMGGQFTGSEEELEKCLLPFAGKHSRGRFLQLIALSRHHDTWNFNAALMFNSDEQLHERAKKLYDAGIKSNTLDLLINK
jgi:hypothetical protein